MKHTSRKPLTKKIKVILFILSVVVLYVGGTALGLYTGALWFNTPTYAEFPIQGVDVSSHQGDIDWQALPLQAQRFAFIKATEGSDFIDKKFKENWENIQKTSLSLGAYHFFTLTSSGTSQAENFIATVPVTRGMLPPVVDIECPVPDTPEKVLALQRELKDMLLMLEAHYGVKPLIYTTEKGRKGYVGEAFSAYPLWIRNVFTRPEISPAADYCPDKPAEGSGLKANLMTDPIADQKEGPGQLQEGKTAGWTFWQYSPRGVLTGYDGKEYFIDMNVFCGGERAFQQFPRVGLESAYP